MSKLRDHAILFALWFDERFIKVTSESLGVSAYVDAVTHTVFIHGSDFHFTKLITEHGKTIEELYEMFIVETMPESKHLRQT